MAEQRPHKALVAGSNPAGPISVADFRQRGVPQGLPDCGLRLESAIHFGADRMPDFVQLLSSSFPGYLRDLETLVNIDCGTHIKVGVDAVVQIVRERMI